jgi:hypothetical protein
MKKKLSFFYLILFFILVSGLAVSVSVQSFGNPPQASASLLDIPSPPPASLDAFYPPKSEQPVYLFSMLDMEAPFNGIIVDLMEEDFENAGKNYEQFKQKYTSVSKMVPEWEQDFPLKPVDDLGAAMQSGDKVKIMASIEEAGKVCGSCHLQNMVKVQQKFHWRDFEEITVTDLVTKESVSFSRLMQYLSMNFSGIGVNLQEGQVANAKNSFDQFKTRFTSLKASCTHCHTTQRKYFTDESVQSYIDELGSALNESPVNPEKVTGLSMKIGDENCSKCHLVHLPAAMTKFGWKMLENMK